jgi:hypothetical protein
MSAPGAGIKHRKNEIFLDVVERLNLLVAANGTLLRSEILGSLKMRSYLSGMPELKLGLNDKLLFEATGRRRPARAPICARPGAATTPRAPPTPLARRSAQGGRAWRLQGQGG